MADGPTDHRAVSGGRRPLAAGRVVSIRMAYEQQQREALRILEGIENGTTSARDLAELVDDADPALLYLIFRWLRKRYADHPNSDTVIGKLVELGNRPSIAAKMKEGQADSVVAWFEDAYSYRDLDAKAFIELIVEKLES